MQTPHRHTSALWSGDCLGAEYKGLNVNESSSVIYLKISQQMVEMTATVLAESRPLGTFRRLVQHFPKYRSRSCSHACNFKELEYPDALDNEATTC